MYSDITHSSAEHIFIALLMQDDTDETSGSQGSSSADDMEEVTKYAFDSLYAQNSFRLSIGFQDDDDRGHIGKAGGYSSLSFVVHVSGTCIYTADSIIFSSFTADDVSCHPGNHSSSRGGKNCWCA